MPILAGIGTAFPSIVIRSCGCQWMGPPTPADKRGYAAMTPPVRRAIAKAIISVERFTWNPPAEFLRFSPMILWSSAETARATFCLGCTTATWRSRFSTLTATPQAGHFRNVIFLFHMRGAAIRGFRRDFRHLQIVIHRTSTVPRPAPNRLSHLRLLRTAPVASGTTFHLPRFLATPCRRLRSLAARNPVQPGISRYPRKDKAPQDPSSEPMSTLVYRR